MIFVTIITQAMLRYQIGYILTVNQANILITNLLGDNLTNLTSLGVYMIFQRYNNNEVQLGIFKIQFYNLIISA